MLPRVAVKRAQLRPELSLAPVQLQPVPNTSKKLQKTEVKLVRVTEMKKQREPPHAARYGSYLALSQALTLLLLEWISVHGFYALYKKTL